MSCGDEDEFHCSLHSLWQIITFFLPFPYPISYSCPPFPSLLPFSQSRRLILFLIPMPYSPPLSHPLFLPYILVPHFRPPFHSPFIPVPYSHSCSPPHLLFLYFIPINIPIPHSLIPVPYSCGTPAWIIWQVANSSDTAGLWYIYKCMNKCKYKSLVNNDMCFIRKKKKSSHSVHKLY